MSRKTRVNRPTTSTTRKMPPGRLVHQSTNLQQVKLEGGKTKWMPLGKGTTRQVS